MSTNISTSTVRPRDVDRDTNTSGSITSTSTCTSADVPTKRITRANTLASRTTVATSSSSLTSTSSSHANTRKRSRETSTLTSTSTSTSTSNDRIDWSFMELEAESGNESSSDEEYIPHTHTTNYKTKKKRPSKKRPRITSTEKEMKTETETQQDRNDPDPETAADEKQRSSYVPSSSSRSISTRPTPTRFAASTFVASSYANMISVTKRERKAHLNTLLQAQQQQLSSTNTMLKVMRNAPADRLLEQFQSLLITTTSSTAPPSWLPKPHVNETPTMFFHRAMCAFLSHSASSLIRPRIFPNSIIHLILSMLSLADLMKCRVLSHQWLEQSHNIASWSSAQLGTYMNLRADDYDTMILSIAHVLRRLYVHGSSHGRTRINPLLKFGDGDYLPFPNLTELDIGHHSFCGRHVIHILQTCTKLQILHIDESCIHFQLTKRMAYLLPNTLTTLTFPIGSPRVMLGYFNRHNLPRPPVNDITILSHATSRTTTAPITGLRTLEVIVRPMHGLIDWCQLSRFDSLTSLSIVPPIEFVNYKKFCMSQLTSHISRISSLTSISIPQPFISALPSLVHMSAPNALRDVKILSRECIGHEPNDGYVEEMLSTLVCAPFTRLHLRPHHVIWHLSLRFLETATRLTHLTLDHVNTLHPQWSLITTHCPHLSHLTLINIQPFGLRSLRAILSIPSIRYLSLEEQHKVSIDAMIILKTSPLVQQLRQLQAQEDLSTSTSTATSPSSSTYDIAPAPANHLILSIFDCEQLTRTEMMATGIFEIISGTGDQKVITEYRLMVQNIPAKDEE